MLKACETHFSTISSLPTSSRSFHYLPQAEDEDEPGKDCQGRISLESCPCTEWALSPPPQDGREGVPLLLEAKKRGFKNLMCIP